MHANPATASENPEEEPAAHVWEQQCWPFQGRRLRVWVRLLLNTFVSVIMLAILRGTIVNGIYVTTDKNLYIYTYFY